MEIFYLMKVCKVPFLFITYCLYRWTRGMLK